MFFSKYGFGSSLFCNTPALLHPILSLSLSLSLSFSLFLILSSWKVAMLITNPSSWFTFVKTHSHLCFFHALGFSQAKPFHCNRKEIFPHHLSTSRQSPDFLLPISRFYHRFPFVIFFSRGSSEIDLFFRNNLEFVRLPLFKFLTTYSQTKL